jgi:23S rRNA (guanosine2251-2'-O)-methyltransferase
MNQLVLVADNIRSIHNVGSLFRSCDGLGVTQLYLCGITPHGFTGSNDDRLPHQIQKLQKELHKTALGAQNTVAWQYYSSTALALKDLKSQGYRVVALEQDTRSTPLGSYKPQARTALVVGPEVTGMSLDTLALCDDVIEITMQGVKESLNVSVAAGIALYTLWM